MLVMSDDLPSCTHRGRVTASGKDPATTSVVVGTSRLFYGNDDDVGDEVSFTALSTSFLKLLNLN